MSPATRDRVVGAVRQALWKDIAEIPADLAFWGDPESEGYKEMEGWRRAASDLQIKVADQAWEWKNNKGYEN